MAKRDFPLGARVRLRGEHRSPARKVLGYRQIATGAMTGPADEGGQPVVVDDLAHPIYEYEQASEHGMIATDAPPQTGTVVGHEPAVYPHTRRRHRVELDHGQGFVTTDFIDLEAFDG